MRYIPALSMVAMLALLGASRAHAGTLTLDFALEEFAGIIGEPAEGTARIVLTGVDDQGRVTADSALGMLQAFDSRGTLDPQLIDTVGGGMATFDLRLPPGSGPFTGSFFSIELPTTPPSAPGVLQVALGNLGVPGGAQVRFFASASGFGFLQVTGREIGRSFSSVPEPVAGAMLLLGLAAHAVGATWRRRTSSSRRS
jgi:hypothetical protein